MVTIALLLLIGRELLVLLLLLLVVEVSSLLLSKVVVILDLVFVVSGVALILPRVDVREGAEQHREDDEEEHAEDVERGPDRDPVVDHIHVRVAVISEEGAEATDHEREHIKAEMEYHATFDELDDLLGSF